MPVVSECWIAEPLPVIPTNLRQEHVWLVVGSLMILATVALAVALLYTRDVMIPFVLAIFITTMVSPLVDFLVLRWRLPGWLAIAISLLVVLTVLTLLSMAMIMALQTIVQTANQYSKEVADLTRRLSRTCGRGTSTSTKGRSARSWKSCFPASSPPPPAPSPASCRTAY